MGWPAFTVILASQKAFGTAQPPRREPKPEAANQGNRHGAERKAETVRLLPSGF
jgi:hypothetical protein